MPTAHEAPAAPYVPPLAPEELKRRNAEMIRLLDLWSEGGEEDERDQRETVAVLRRALGPDREMGYRSVFK